MLPPFGGNTATVIHALHILQIQNLHLQVQMIMKYSNLLNNYDSVI